jgi:hypothetical protein
MQGEKLGEFAGKVTSRRVLANPGGGPKMESSHQITGKLLGVDVMETGTYWAALRADGVLYGEGNGIAMGHGGEMATWIGQGIGRFGKDGSVSFRGAVYYHSATPKWSRMNTVAAIFEYEVSADGNCTSHLWEWK